MKRLIKWSLILAGLLLTVGVGLHTAGAVMGGGAESSRYFARHWEDFTDHWGGIASHWGHMDGILGETERRDSGALTDPVTAIDVDVDCGDITLREGKCFSVSVAWNFRGFTLDYELEDGVLKVESESRSSFLNGISGLENEVTITVPAGSALDSLELSTNLGDIDVDAACTANETNLSTNLGNVKCVGVWAAELTAESDLGDVDIRLPGSKGDYLWKLSTDLGKLSVDGERQSGSTVGAAIRGGTGKCRVEANSDLGDVSVRFDGQDPTLYPHHDEHFDDHTYHSGYTFAHH